VKLYEFQEVANLAWRLMHRCSSCVDGGNTFRRDGEDRACCLAEPMKMT
jgi:hypothetical protein